MCRADRILILGRKGVSEEWDQMLLVLQVSREQSAAAHTVRAVVGAKRGKTRSAKDICIMGNVDIYYVWMWPPNNICFCILSRSALRLVVNLPVTAAKARLEV